MKTLILTLLLAGLGTASFAHSGGTDIYGCHYDHRTGIYHCH
ncbi:MAG: YHYH domain-containing protein [Proteobacteria bacterium]|nr:YHYH domain-containing protein [Bacteroidota bacterium]NBX85997.1 YHYH domain-containing protein [Pseudomonadota bacterium]